MSYQLCIAHVRKHVTKRTKSIYEQAEKEWGEQNEKLEKLSEDLEVLKGLLEELPEEGGRRVGRLHRGYLWAAPPRRKGHQAKEASAAYRMRMLTLKLWNKWPKIRPHLARPELGLDGTNNATERSISKSKVRYKSMRGYKSLGGMENGIALTQWLYRGRRARPGEGDGGGVNHSVHLAKTDLQIRPPSMGQLRGPPSIYPGRS